MKSTHQQTTPYRECLQLESSLALLQCFVATHELQCMNWKAKKAAKAAFFACFRKLFCLAGRCLRLGFCLWSGYRRRNHGLFCRTRIALLEFVDTTGCIHDLVLASVKRVRLGGHLDADHRILVAIGPFHFLLTLGLDSRAGQEFEVARRIKKDYFVVFGMGIRFHAICLSLRKGWPAWLPLCRQVFKESTIMQGTVRKGKPRHRYLSIRIKKRRGP